MNTDSLTSGIAGIVLDAVGTLIEPDPSVAEVYRSVALDQGVALERGVVLDRFRRCFREAEVDDLHGPMVTDEAVEHRRWRGIVAAVLPELPEPDRGFEALWEHFARPDAWRCFDEVPEALRALSAAGFSIRIGSNFDARLRSVVAGMSGLSDWVDRLVISSEVGYRKPHPAFFEAACRSLGLPPERVLCVGDDLENDVAGATRAGLRAVWLDRSRRGRPDRPGVANLSSLVDELLAATGRTDVVRDPR